MKFLKLSLAVCALLGYTSAIKTQTKVKGGDFGETLKKIEKGSKIDGYIQQVGKGGQVDGYIAQLGQGGVADEYAGYLKQSGAGDVAAYLASLQGVKGDLRTYLNGAGQDYDSIVANLKKLGYSGSIEDYQDYLKNYKGEIPKKLVQSSGINYDYSCKAKHLEDCLLNDITLYGPNVVLVNLDNSCQIDKIEREGIFLQTGDLLFVTGREHKCAFQEWDEPEDTNLDYDVLFPGLDYDMPLQTAPGYKQEIVVLEAVGMGQTSYDIDLTWGGDVVRSVSIDVYVDQQPQLAVATPRHSC